MVIPYGQIATLFLDAGNTLICIDFDWVAAELEARGLPVSAAAVCRAEAAARVQTSEVLSRGSTSEGLDPFQAMLAGILSQLDAVAGRGGNLAAKLAAELGPVLLTPGRSDLLWRTVIPGVPEALASLRESGLDLVVVSNSDGTVEQNLKDRGLAPYLSHIVDSAVVGIEKPDPRIFEYALAASGARRESTVHVGDIYAADVEGARAAGLDAILLDPFGDWENVHCRKAVDLGELARRIQQAQ